jgi:hypothetical protein
MNNNFNYLYIMNMNNFENTQTIEKVEKNETGLFIHEDQQPIVYKKKTFRKIIPLFYRNGDPLIVIGPHCILITHNPRAGLHMPYSCYNPYIEYFLLLYMG